MLPRIVTGWTVITSTARWSSRFDPRAMCRRRSPSVTMPSSRRCVVHDAGHAETLAVHLVDDVRHRRVATDASGRRRPACISDSTRMSFRPRRPPGCRSAKWSASKAFALRQRHRQGVAQRQRRGGAGRRRQVHRTRLFRDVAAQRHVGRLAQRRLRVPGHRDQPRADPTNRLEQPDELVRLAAVGQREHHVVGLDDAEVAVNGLGGVQEDRRRAGARQRGRDLVRDDAGLAHAGQDDAARAALKHVERAFEVARRAGARARESPALRFRARGAPGPGPGWPSRWLRLGDARP